MLAARSPITNFDAMGHWFSRGMTALGFLLLVPEVAHAENGLDKANHAIVDAQNKTKGALRESGNKVNNDIVNARNKTKRALKNGNEKIDNDIVDTQHKVKRSIKGH